MSIIFSEPAVISPFSFANVSYNFAFTSSTLLHSILPPPISTFSFHASDLEVSSSSDAFSAFSESSVVLAFSRFRCIFSFLRLYSSIRFLHFPFCFPILPYLSNRCSPLPPPLHVASRSKSKIKCKTFSSIATYWILETASLF